MRGCRASRHEDRREKKKVKEEGKQGRWEKLGGREKNTYPVSFTPAAALSPPIDSKSIVVRAIFN